MMKVPKRLFIEFVRVFPTSFREFETFDCNMTSRHSCVRLRFVDVFPINTLVGHVQDHPEVF